MNKLAILPLVVLISGCAGPIAAWKGRAYGEHSINENTLFTMSGTFRTGRSSIPANTDGKVILCLEPFPEVASIMGGATVVGVPVGKGSGSISDTATPVSVKGHESSTAYQSASLAYTIACNEYSNGIIDQPTYREKIVRIVDALTQSVTEKAK